MHNISQEHLKIVSEIMKREPVNPIGMCFESSAAQMLFAEDTPHSARLVHGLGIANMPGQEGKTIAHAWIEFEVDGQIAAFDTTWGLAQLASDYKANLKVFYSVEYTLKQVRDLWEKTDYPGPWDPKIKEVADMAGPEGVTHDVQQVRKP